MSNPEKELLDLLESEKQAEAMDTNEDDAVGDTTLHRTEWDSASLERPKEPIQFSAEAAKRMKDSRTRLLQDFFSNKVTERHVEKTAGETLLEQTRRVTGSH